LKESNSDIFGFDINNHPMVHEYIKEFDVARHVSKKWRIFMCSLIHNPIPKTDPGWKITMEQKQTLIDHYKNAVLAFLPNGEDDFVNIWQKVKQGETSDTSSGVVLCSNKAQILIKKTKITNKTNVLDIEDEAPGITKTKQYNFSDSSQFNSKSLGSINKLPVMPGTQIYKNVIRVIKVIKDLDNVTKNTDSWKIQACFSGNNRETPSWFSLHPGSSYCPIGGVHSNSGKTIINISKSGRISATCLSGRCSDMSWSATQKLSEKAKSLLWN